METTKKQSTIDNKVNKGYKDPTKTGPLSYRDLRELNNRLSDEACLAIIQNGNMEEIDKLITCKDYL